MKIAAFAYLKAQQQKQDKIKSIVFTKLEMQDYLANGDRNINVSKLIFKARGETLDIKLQKRWKYEDVLCSGCKNEEDLRNEILRCKYQGEENEKLSYSMFFSENVDDMILVGKEMLKRLKVRKRIREEVT